MLFMTVEVESLGEPLSGQSHAAASAHSDLEGGQSRSAMVLTVRHPGATSVSHVFWIFLIFFGWFLMCFGPNLTLRS